jgi:hypothetical protein
MYGEGQGEAVEANTRRGGLAAFLPGHRDRMPCLVVPRPTSHRASRDPGSLAGGDLAGCLWFAVASGFGAQAR